MQWPQWHFPQALARLGQRLPQWPHGCAAALGLELARRAGWLQPPEELEGKRFALVVQDLGMECRFECRHGRFHPSRATPGNPVQADLRLVANAFDYARMASGETDPDTLFFQRKLQIEGDTELGLLVKNWLDASEKPAFLRPGFSLGGRHS